MPESTDQVEIAKSQLNVALAGRYRIERELGQGGMATVYVARDLRLDRMVAIKVFSGARARRMETSRFEREIRIAARLNHPQIVPVHDSGEANGLPYYVMPLIEGESLRARLAREGRLSVSDALGIARAVARALDYAHRQGYVHRDIKPENILLHEGGALVADFGVAMALREASNANDHSTAPGLAVGTPAYMSPEQAAGEWDLDGRTDQYAVACVLFEMLAGHPPFSGNARQVMLRHVVEPPPSVRVERPDVPWPVDGALLRAMAKEPADRFESAADWADALVARSGEVEATSGASTRRRAIAVLPFINATSDPENEYLSDGITDDLISALANVAGLRVSSRTSVFALKGRKEDVRSLGALLGVGTVLEGTVRRAGNRLRLTAQLSDATDGRLLWSERFDRDDADIFAIQDEITATIVRTLRSRLLGELGEPVAKRYTENPRAYNLYLRGRFAWNLRSAEGMEQAITYFEQAIAEDAGYALAWSGLADAYAIGVDYRNGPVVGGIREGQGTGAPRDRARRRPGRGAHLARVGHVHPRLGLGRCRAGIPPRHRGQPELRLRAPVVRLAAGLAGPPHRSVAAGRAGRGTRSDVGVGAARTGLAALLRARHSAGDRAHAAGARDEPDRAGIDGGAGHGTERGRQAGRCGSGAAGRAGGGAGGHGAAGGAGSHAGPAGASRARPRRSGSGSAP